MKAVVLLSGGIDSASALYWCKEKGWDVYALTFDYELEQSPELKAARKVAKGAGVKRHLVGGVPLLQGVEGFSIFSQGEDHRFRQRSVSGVCSGQEHSLLRNGGRVRGNPGGAEDRERA